MNRTIPSVPDRSLAAIRARLSASGGRRYWRSLEEAADTREFREWLHREFPAGASEWLGAPNRRGFLKLMAASLALGGLTACTRQPIETIVPYVRQPAELTPGLPRYYATAMTLGGFAAGLLVESHEGRPTKVEGNPDHPMSLGASNIFHQATLLDLYDPDRSQAVLRNGQISSWETFLSAIHENLRAQQASQGAGLRLLTETVTSPSLHAQIRALLKAFPSARWHQFEPLARDEVYAGARLAFGRIVETQHDFARARVVLSLSSDFLFSHPASLRYARHFMDRRRVSSGQAEMNRLYVVESTPSVTGSNADHRLALPAQAIEAFARAVAKELGIPPHTEPNVAPSVDPGWVAAVAGDLEQNRGASIVIVGEEQPAALHALVHTMNHFLGNVDSTVFYTASAEAEPVNQVESLRDLVDGMKAGQVDTLVMLGGNPAFNAPADLQFARHLSQARLRVHLSPDVNETSALCQWHLPQNHFLESWSDARAFDGTVSLIQPLILPLHGGKSAHDVIEAMIRQPGRSNYDIVRECWIEQSRWPDFDQGWRRALHDGVVAGTALPTVSVALRPPPPAIQTAAAPADLEIHFRPDPTVGDGRFLNNGWLQELPKPMLKLVWDNAALVSPKLAEREGLASGDLVDVEFRGRALRTPVWITPGQAENTITLYLGYGRDQVGRVGLGTGFNAYALRPSEALWFGAGARMTKTGRRHPLVSTQIHHAIDAKKRQLIRGETRLESLRHPGLARQTTDLNPPEATLFNPAEHRYDGHRWGMSIDLTTCLGCNACVVACQAENNIPVVGKDQVGRGREMHWIRLDTYYEGNLDHPSIYHQPVPCMQCENAPCELVCPVGATVHDKEGLNVQVYNRCIGTRYCSNNCPYKVRRFNFLQYADPITPSLKALRNPNVTVRSRGVMEKCTYCVQRISAARITAKKENRPVRDGEIRTACQQVCPADAIVFGDLSDPASRVSRLKALALDFSMLGELNTHPRTTYLARLRNPHLDLEPRGPGASLGPAHG